jgi:hypothetical protein
MVRSLPEVAMIFQRTACAWRFTVNGCHGQWMRVRPVTGKKLRARSAASSMQKISLI